MKLLSIILTFLILSIGTAPCPEEPDRDCTNQLSAASHEKPDKPEGLCDAFCHCSSSPFSVLLPESPEVPAAEAMPAEFRMAVVKSVMSVSSVIWQPPRPQTA